MRGKKLSLTLAIAGCLMMVSSLWADVVYKQRMKMEMMGGMMQMEFQTTTFVKGDKQRTEMISPPGKTMRVPGTGGITIIRLDKDVVWTISPDTKTYKETPLKEMFAPQPAEEKAKGQAKVNLPKFAVKQTKESKLINGFKCQKVIMTMEGEAIDDETGEKISYSMSGDLWITKGEKRLKELNNFQKKLSEKTGGSSTSFIDKFFSGTQKDQMEEFTKKMNEIGGFPILMDASMKMKGNFVEEEGEEEGEEEEMPAQMKGMMEAMKTGNKPIFTIHMVVTEVKSTSIKDSQFALPQGLQKMSIK